MRDLLYFVIGILLGLICIFFDGSAVMAQSTNTAAGIAYAVEGDWLIIISGGFHSVSLTEGAGAGDVAAAPLGESLARARAPQLYMPPAARPTLDAAEPRPIKGLIIFRSSAGLDAQATQPDPKANRHVANADAQVVAPAA